MSYEVQWFATDDADFGKSVSLFDNNTGQPLAEAEGATFALAVKRKGSVVLSASSDEGTISRPDTHTAQFVFTADQMAGLCPGTTYDIGMTMTTNTGKTQILTGSLAIIDGGF